MTCEDASFNVLHVTATSWVLPNQVVPIADAIVARGWDVDVACPDGPEATQLAARGITHIPVEFSRKMASLHHGITLMKLVILLRSQSYDLVHLHGPFPGILGRIAALMSRTPAIYHCRGTFFEGEYASFLELFLKRLYSFSERLVGPGTAWAFTLNSADSNDLVSIARVPANRVSLLPVGGCGLDLEYWSPDRVGRLAQMSTSNQQEVPDDHIIIGFVGRLVGEKGIIDLLNAFELVYNKGHSVHLVFVGGVLESERDQVSYQELCRLIREKDLERHVTLTGELVDPAPVIAGFDMLVLPSYREGFGQVLVEAGALGVPVIAYRSRGTESAVINESTGILVRKGDVGGLSIAMEALIHDPDYARRLGHNAMRRAQTELGRKEFMAGIMKVYDHLLSNNIQNAVQSPRA